MSLPIVWTGETLLWHGNVPVELISNECLGEILSVQCNYVLNFLLILLTFFRLQTLTPATQLSLLCLIFVFSTQKLSIHVAEDELYYYRGCSFPSAISK